MIERKLTGLLRSVLTSPLGGFFVGISRAFYPTQSAGWLDVHSVDLYLPRLQPEFSSYKLIQISDFHIGTWIDRDRLVYAIEKVNELEPDLVAITGDFVTVNPKDYQQDLIHALRRLRAVDGIVAVLGNHDHWTNPGLIREVLKNCGVTDLSNKVRSIIRGSACLHLAGVDDVMEKLARLDVVLDQIPESGAAIILVHEPDFADQVAEAGRFDLQLSGHSHGGQIRIPGLKPLIVPSFARKYPSGRYQVKKLILYTNRGLGTAEIQVRLNCRPEIACFNLYPQKNPPTCV